MKFKLFFISNFLNKKPKPLILVLIFYVVGILIGRFSIVPFAYLCYLSICSLFLSSFIRNKFSILFLLVAFLCVGALRTQNFNLVDKNDIINVAKYYYGKQSSIKGAVCSDVEKRRFFNKKKTVFYLKVNEVKAPWRWEQKKGKVLVNVFDDIDVKYGDYVELNGRLHKPFEFSNKTNFSYQNYLKNKGINLIFSVKKGGIKIIDRNRGNYFLAISFRARNRLKKALDDNLTSNESGIMNALLLGDRSGVPSHIKDLFIHTGTAHVLAISGLHIGIVAFIFLILVKLLPVKRKIQFAITMILLVFYAFITGSRPSVVRATIMAVIFLGSFILERETDSLNTLTVAALLILFFNPFSLFDAGFQLSFASVLSIIVINPVISAKIAKIANIKHKISMPLVQFIAVSLSAWLGIVGLIALYFDIITPITILANVLVIPLITILIALGILLALSGLYAIRLAPIFSLLVKMLLNIMAGIVFLLEKIPFAYIKVNYINFWIIFIYYLALAGFLNILLGEYGRKEQ